MPVADSHGRPIEHVQGARWMRPVTRQRRQPCIEAPGDYSPPCHLVHVRESAGANRPGERNPPQAAPYHLAGRTGESIAQYS